MASVVPPAFWAQAKDELARRTGRELIWLAETVHKPFLKFMRDRGFQAWSDGEVLQVFDLSYDHDGATALEDYFAGRGALGRYLDLLLVQETMNPAGSLKLRFAENHDLPRAADKIRGEDRWKAWKAECRFFTAEEPAAGVVMLKWDDRPEGARARYTAVLNLEDRFGTLDRDWHIAGDYLLGGVPVDLKKGAPIPRSPVLVRTRD